MKIAKYGPDRIAAVEGAKLIDLNLAFASYARHELREALPGELADARVPSDLLKFIQAGRAALDAAYAALEFVRPLGDWARGPRGEPIVLDLGATPLRAPLPSLGSKLICMGRNFAEHAHAAQAATMAREAAGEPRHKAPESSRRPKRPAGFIKFADTVVGPGDPVTYPSRTRQFDYECEIAAIIGTPGKDIAEANAMNHVFGYSVFCDYSARDQTTDLEDMNWVRHHKNFDCAAALGPWILTADELPDPHGVPLRTWVNGQARQDGNTSEMIYKFPRIIEYYSVDQTLYPGDLFASGTCQGTAMEKKDGSWFLEPGDTVEFEIPQIGRFSNRVVAKR
ncbi:MAG: fumarylacetoacetate hydrolase family protein [Burkholderiales bacterium]|nr:fumarylacetoacetate hydrolase family protein [Burkholderiales bacterium]